MAHHHSRQNSQTGHLLKKRHHSLAYRKTRILPCSTSPKGRFAMWCVRGCFNAAVTIAWCGYQRKVFVQLATVAVWMIVNRNWPSPSGLLNRSSRWPQRNPMVDIGMCFHGVRHDDIGLPFTEQNLTNGLPVHSVFTVSISMHFS